MSTSRFLVGITADRRIPEQATFTRAAWRRTGRPRGGQFVPERAPALIDGLIDRVHLDWPETSFVLALPSGEQVFVPRHAAGPRCTADHAGYFGRFVRPYCAVDQSRGEGRCRMTPFAVDEQPSPTPFYEVDIASGLLVKGAGPAPLTSRPRRTTVRGRGITTLADVPSERHSKVLHLCRYPEKCCTVCDRHRRRCWHPVGGRSW